MSTDKSILVKYDYKFFDPPNVEDAKKIILTDDAIPDQWETETEWTMNFFRKFNLFNEDSVVLDWGCGIGRLAKPIIEEFNCKVVGVDFQPNMLKYAIEYVDHPNFTAINNAEFSQLPDDYFTVGIAVWALQHTLDTKKIIKNIRKKLKFNSKFCVFDANTKSWPVLPINQSQTTNEDVLLTVTVANDIEEITENRKKQLWAHPYHFNNLKDLKNYFSVDTLENDLKRTESDVTLSQFLDISWRGIFINNKK